jgi:hypothetical protein
MSKQFRLSRRTVLKGAGTIAIALPWLEAMESARVAHAAPTTVPARRFVGVYTPGGTVLSRFWPTGTETAFTLSEILKPLEPVLDKLLILQGVDMKSARGEIHQEGMVAWLTGAEQGEEDAYPMAPSLDQVLAERISIGKSRRSLHMAVRWATGKSMGRLHPMNAANFEASAPHAPIPPSLDPQAIFKSLFGSLDPAGGRDEGRIARKKSILDYVDRRYVTLSQRLGADDRQRLEQHLEKLRELERALESGGLASADCKAPTLVNTADYRPDAGLYSSEDGSEKDISTDAAIPKVGRFMTDMLVMALACDLTGVATLQWSDTEAKHTFPWLGLSEHHHYYQHDGGFSPDECEQIAIWYSEQHAYLLQAMDQIDMGGHTLLDESVVFFGSELSDPPTHRTDNMPFLLAGGGGGLRGGRHLKYGSGGSYGGVSHNDLLVAILNLFGDERQVFGAPEHCTGPLSGLVT